MSTNGSHSQTIKVVMLPWLAQGHVRPFLELAKKLATRDIFHIYLCSTPIILSSIKKRVEEYSLLSGNISLVELDLPSPPPELPPHYHTTTNLPKHLLPTLKTVLRTLGPESLSNILKTLAPDFVIYDMHQPWVSTVAVSHNIPTVEFNISGAAVLSVYITYLRQSFATFPFPGIVRQEGFSGKNESQEDEERRVACEALDKEPSRIVLFNTFRELEGKYIDYLPNMYRIKKVIIPVGPLVKDDDLDGLGSDSQKILKWLDGKQASSTVFVSFGSECYLSKQQISEMARGLELSRVNFIWVLRFPNGEEMSVQEALPSGFLERLVTGGDRGLVVEKWAPQAKILAHPNTGGFVSHCGWNSTLESLRFGVPIIAMPMLYEQPMNASVLEEVGAGVEVKRNKVDGSFNGEAIAEVIRKVVVDKDGEGIRMKARELSESIRVKGDVEIDGLVREFVHLSKDTKQMSA